MKTTNLRITRRIIELAQIHLDSFAEPLFSDAASDYNKWLTDLAFELEAAIEDRWLEWKRARLAGLPFGEGIER